MLWSNGQRRAGQALHGCAAPRWRRSAHCHPLTHASAHLLYQRAQFDWSAPGLCGAATSVAHPMTVRAEQRKVLEGRPDLTGNMQRKHVVHLYVAMSEAAVERMEVEVTDLAGQGPFRCQHGFDLPLSEPRIPLALLVEASEEVPLRRREPAVFAAVVQVWRQQCSALHSGPYPVCGGLHLSRTCEEGGHHKRVEPAATRPPAFVGRMCRCQVGSLPADAPRRAELGRADLGGMEGRQLQQRGEVAHGRVPFAQLFPPVSRNKGTCEDELIPLPGRILHGQYRMGVRSAWGRPTLVELAAWHTLREARCQWDMSPSVKSSCNECPWEVQKEGA